MQNFTFGRKGTNWFLFTFLLLIGTLPSFGQNDCPEVGDFPTSQTFCFTQTISELDTNGYPVYQSDNTNDTQPIPGGEFLVDGETYYVGGASGDCARIEITTTVNDAPLPSNDFGAGGFDITTCTPANFDESGLANLFDTTVSGYTIEVYDSEEGTTPFVGELQPGASYFVAQVPGTQDAQNNVCPSQRVSVGYNPTQIGAPDVENAQIFCENATVADLQAEGNYDNTQAIRWYRSQNATSPLPQNTELIDGATYYVGQVVNERESPLPPCETSMDDRAAVTVSLEAPQIIDTVSATVCISDINNPTIEGFEDFYLTLMGNPGEGTFNPPIADLVAQYENDPFAAPFATTYTLDGTCEAIEASVTVINTEEANAGAFNDLTLTCSVDDFLDLNTLENTDSNASTEGTFSGQGVENGMFDITQGPGEYDITYTVDGSSSECVTGTDSTTFTITVGEGEAEILEPIFVDLCESEVLDNPSNGEINEFLLAQVAQKPYSMDLNGTFEPGVDELREQFQNQNGLGDLSTTYTVNCKSVDININISELTDANAGSFADIPLSCDATDIIVLADLDNLDANATTGGEFSANDPNVLNSDGNFDPSLATPGETYTITYSVDDSDFCTIEGSTDSTSFDIIFSGEANAGNDVEGSICLSEVEEIAADFDPTNPDSDAVLTDLFERFNWNGDTNGTFEPSATELGLKLLAYYQNEDRASSLLLEGTYTVGDTESECGIDEANFSVTILDEGPANAGDITDQVVCTIDGVIDLNDYLTGSGAQLGGTFSGEGVENNMFDTAIGPNENGYTITYTVSEDDSNCIEGTDSTTFILNVSDDVQKLDPISVELCENELVENPSIGEINEFLLAQVAQKPYSMDLNGSFEPGIDELREQLQNQNGLGNLNTTYTVNCKSVDININISELTAANAGSFEDIPLSCDATDIIVLADLDNLDANATTGGTFTSNESSVLNGDGNFDPSLATPGETYTITYSVDDSAFCTVEGSTDSTSFTITLQEAGPANAGNIGDQVACTTQGMIDLTQYLKESGAQLSGTFTGQGVEDNMFDPSIGENIDGYTITYTVSGDEDDECIIGEDSTTFQISVLDDPNVGEDNEVTICVTEVQENPSVGAVRNYFVNLLDNGVPTNGTFEPSMEDIRQQYLNNPIGTFTTTYTLGSGSCSDSAELTVEVVDAIDANAGEIEDQTLCSSDADLNLYTLLADDANTNGTFEGYEDGIFSPSEIGAGSYEITYSVTEDAPCVVGEASTTFTIDVIQGANAGDDMEVAFCDNEEAQDLYNYISADADMDGTFTDLEDGIFNPADYDAGSYEFIYTVTSDDDQCGGDDTATITVNLGVAPAAPNAAETRAFCTIDVPTVALLSAEGTNLTWYADAELSTMLSDDDVLESGDYYVTQTSDEGCESNAAVTTVNVVDSPAPTISSDYELCEFDDPTISDLTAEINESGEVTWYASTDATTPLSNNEMLSDGTTYYASLISENGCESSERLAVTVTLEDCELLFPEAITPNGDGLNEKFVIKKITREYPNFNITIFNRWGNVIYKGNASTPEWDGTSNQSGNLGDGVLPVGVYFYVVDFNDGSTKPRQGKVYLSR